MSLLNRMLLPLAPRLAYRREAWRLLARSAYTAEDASPRSAGWERTNRTGEATNQAGRDVIRARAAVRPIIRRSQPVAGPIPGLDGQFVFSGLGSKGVTTSPWSAAQLAGHLVCGTDLPPDLLPAALWK